MVEDRICRHLTRPWASSLHISALNAMTIPNRTLLRIQEHYSLFSKGHVHIDIFGPLPLLKNYKHCVTTLNELPFVMLGLCSSVKEDNGFLDVKNFSSFNDYETNLSTVIYNLIPWCSTAKTNRKSSIHKELQNSLQEETWSWESKKGYAPYEGPYKVITRNG